MESDKASKNRSSEFFIKSNFEFENLLKNKLKWNKKQWGAAGESGSRINKLCNSLNYWSSKLKGAVEDVSIVITIFNMHNDVKVELFEIIKGIESLECNVQVQGFSSFRNPRYLAIYFKNKAERDLVKERFRLLRDSYVVYLSWALEEANNVIFLKVHWLPMTIDVDIIKKELDKYVQCVEQERKHVSFLSGREMPSGNMSFKVNLNKGVKAEDIPHIMSISNMETLVTVSGRLPLCLNCDVLGHISKECKVRYCNVCNSLKPKQHLCSDKDSRRSYATIVKNSNEAGDRIDQDDWGAEIVVEDCANSQTDTGKVISNRILQLETKIKKLESDDTCKPKLQNFMCGENSGQGGKDTIITDNSQNDDSDNQSENLSSVEFSGDEKDKLDSVAVSINSVAQQASAKVTKKKRRKTSQGDIARLSKSSKNKVLSVNEKKSDPEETQLRSYGKKNYNNARRIKEEKTFDKVMEKQEFVFQD